ncbi:hypothetical protein Q5752_004127 [Cryptotrichosporon argae]
MVPRPIALLAPALPLAPLVVPHLVPPAAHLGVPTTAAQVLAALAVVVALVTHGVPRREGVVAGVYAALAVSQTALLALVRAHTSCVLVVRAPSAPAQTYDATPRCRAYDGALICALGAAAVGACP